MRFLDADAGRRGLFFDFGGFLTAVWCFFFRRGPPRSTTTGLLGRAVRAALAEDQEDLAAFEERVAEPTMTYEALLDDLNHAYV